MQTLAILAPDLPDATPAQRSRAHRALLEQMMLLARGHSVDSPAVRCAAALVGSAVAHDPVEFELAVTAEDDVASAVPAPAEVERERGEAAKEPAWMRGEGYARYLRTIMSAGAN